MLSFSAVRFRRATVVFFDFKNALLTLRRRWKRESLTRLGLPRGVLQLFAQLYAGCKTLLRFAGEVAGRLRVTSGIKQRCPMIGSIVTLCIVPFRRCLLVRSLVDLVRLTACADNSSIIFANIWRDLPPIVADIGRRASASGLKLSVARRVLVPRR